MDELGGRLKARTANRGNGSAAALKTGLPQRWQKRAKGHWAARIVGGLESRISAFGVARIPAGHSYIVLATKDDPHG